MNSGTRRVRHQGALFLRAFFLGMQKEGTRRLKAKPFSEKARRLKAKPFSKKHADKRRNSHPKAP